VVSLCCASLFWAYMQMNKKHPDRKHSRHVWLVAHTLERIRPAVKSASAVPTEPPSNLVVLSGQRPGQNGYVNIAGESLTICFLTSFKSIRIQSSPGHPAVQVSLGLVHVGSRVTWLYGRFWRQHCVPDRQYPRHIWLATRQCTDGLCHKSASCCLVCLSV
jgi:hypothetical protein